MSGWLNNKFMINKNIEVKPCHKLKYCPYGQLIEEFPLTKRRTRYSCKTFGHNCPVFYMAENITE